MGKDFTCNILKKYLEVDEKDDFCTILAEIQWNGKPCNGLELRNYNKKKDEVYKGIRISDKGLKKLTKKLIELGYDADDEDDDIVETVEKNKKEQTIFSQDDFEHMFNNVYIESTSFKRDNYGILRDDGGRKVILKRRNSDELSF